MVVCRTKFQTSTIRKIQPILICSFVSYCIKFINMHNYLQTEGGGRKWNFSVVKKGLFRTY